jgi:AraC-like DNA-binding protein
MDNLNPARRTVTLTGSDPGSAADGPMIENLNLNLLSGGYFRCEPAWTRKANSLDRCYKVYFPVSGAAELAMEAGDYEIKSGRVYFISGFKLRRQICAREMKVYWLHFIPESFHLRHVLDQLPPVLSWSRAAEGWPARSYENVCRLFEQPFSEQNRPRGDIATATVCRVSGLLLNLVAHCLDGMDETTFKEFHPDFYRLKPILDFMHQHYRENLSLSKLAGMAGLAPNYFHRRFKRSLGVTPYEYLLSERLNQARHLLASTRLSIKETADAVGYRDPLYFSRIFSKQLQMSPVKYRAAHQINRFESAETGHAR